jgi:hypothetical protein
VSRRDRRRPAGPRQEAPEPAAPRAQVEELLARGKTRDAVEAARQLYKQTRSADAEALLVDAYAARIRGLIGSGLAREARELASLVVERHPGMRARILPLVQESAARAGGDLGPLLAAIASAEGAARRELERTLRRVIVDPRALAEHPALPEGDPLRQAARAAGEVFAAVTAGPLPESALARLDAVARHSPLAPWKLLVRAIDAYYRRDDAAVLANCSAIAPDSAPARLVPALSCLAGHAPGAERPTLAEGALLDRVGGGRARFGASLAELSAALGVKDPRRAATAARDLAEAAMSAPPAFRATVAATLLTRWLRLGLNPQPLMTALVRGRRDLDTQRQLALAFERVGAWEAAIPTWDAYLHTAQQAGAVPRAGREPSRVLLRMAELIPEDVEEMLDFAMAEDEAELAELIRTGEVPDCFDRGRLLDRARAADPDARVFRALVAHWKARDERRAEGEARAWRAEHPRDLEPLLFLARAAEQRGAERTALELLAEAERIDRVNPEVRRGRFRVLLSSAERHVREGTLDLALEDIGRLAGEPEAAERDRPAYVAALRWAAARRAGDSASAAAIEHDLGARLANPLLVDLLLASVAQNLGLDAAAQPRRSPARATAGTPRLQTIEAVARGADLMRGLERPLGVPEDLLARIELNARGAPAGHLHSICTLALRLNRASLAYAASGAGLELDSALVHRFLLARGRALVAAVPLGCEFERARRCLRAARTLANRVRDTEAAREATVALRACTAPFDDDGERRDRDRSAGDVRRVIEHERSRAGMPRFDAAPRPRRPRRSRRRPAPATGTQGMLDFLQERP